MWLAPIEYYYLWTYDIKKRFNKLEADVLFQISYCGAFSYKSDFIIEQESSVAT